MAIHEAIRIEKQVPPGVEIARRSIVATAAAAIWLVLLDAAIAAVALPLAYWLTLKAPVLVWPAGSPLPLDVVNSFRPYLYLTLAAPLVRFVTAKHYGLYRLRGEFSFLGDVISLVKAATVGSLVIVLFAFLYHGGKIHEEYSYSRLVFVIDWALALAAVGTVRIAVRGIQIGYRRHERNLIPTLIVGEGELAELCVAEISERSRLGYRVIGA